MTTEEEDSTLRVQFETWVTENCRQISYPVYNCAEFSIIINTTRYLVVKREIPEKFIGVAM